MALTDVTANVQQQITELVRNAQDFAVENVRNWAGAVERVIPEEPRQRITAQLPRAEEALDRAFDFATELLDSQKQFAHRLVDALSAGVGNGAQRSAA